jgi:hypothetical protein
MTLGNVIPELLRTVPEFTVDEADAEEGLTYLVLNDFVRFALELDPSSHAKLVQRAFAFVEDLCGSSDREVQMLARDVAWAIAEHSKLQRFKPFIGKSLLKYIRESPVGTLLLEASL